MGLTPATAQPPTGTILRLLRMPPLHFPGDRWRWVCLHVHRSLGPSCFLIVKLSLARPWPASSVRWSMVPICHSRGFDLQPGRTQESPNGGISPCDGEPTFLLSSSLKISLKITKEKGHCTFSSSAVTCAARGRPLVAANVVADTPEPPSRSPVPSDETRVSALPKPRLFSSVVSAPVVLLRVFA